MTIFKKKQISKILKERDWPIDQSIHIPGNRNIRIPTKVDQADRIRDDTNVDWVFQKHTGRIAPELHYFDKKRKILWLLKLAWSTLGFEIVSEYTRSQGLFYSLDAILLASNFRKDYPEYDVRYICTYLSEDDYGKQNNIWIDEMPYRMNPDRRGLIQLSVPKTLKNTQGHISGNYGHFMKYPGPWESTSSLRGEMIKGVKLTPGQLGQPDPIITYYQPPRLLVL